MCGIMIVTHILNIRPTFSISGEYTENLFSCKNTSRVQNGSGKLNQLYLVLVSQNVIYMNIFDVDNTPATTMSRVPPESVLNPDL